mmetsp:Transcript_49614/g.153218  ORF Transcript_49614/g.153218 Transcript_49614/m.153218 type:complete len:200 (-) Transcript_49614:292-891(-)
MSLNRSCPAATTTPPLSGSVFIVLRSNGISKIMWFSSARILFASRSCRDVKMTEAPYRCARKRIVRTKSFVFTVSETILSRRDPMMTIGIPSSRSLSWSGCSSPPRRLRARAMSLSGVLLPLARIFSKISLMRASSRFSQKVTDCHAVPGLAQSTTMHAIAWCTFSGVMTTSLSCARSLPCASSQKWTICVTLRSSRLP